VRSIFRRREVERELDEELRFHLEARIQQEIDGGRTPDQARCAALRAMGGIEQRKEECRDMRHMNIVDNLVRDIHFAVRTLTRNPGFTLATLGALVVGIGANTAVFSVLNGVLLRPLPYADPDRLVMIFDSFQQQGMERGPASIADFLDWKAHSRSFRRLDAIANQRYTLTGDGEAEQIPGLSVTASFFETLGVQPLLGRAFADGDDQPGRAQTVLIGERLWRRRYGSKSTIVGKEISMNGRQFTVIGVMPDDFRFGGEAEVWSILTLDPPTRRGPFFIQGVARLKPGVTLDQAAAEMQSIARRVEQDNPKDYARLRFPVVDLRESVVGDIRQLLWVLSGAVFFVFLIAVTNVANLMLARATARQREIAIRLSIGAGRGQLVRQLMTESLILSLAGGALGLALAHWGVSALRWMEPNGLPRLTEIRVDSGVLLFTLLVSVASAVIFGLGPALSASRTALSQGLKEGGRGGESHAHRRVRGILVVGQVGLSVLLLIGAGLLIRSSYLLGSVAPGFHAPPERVLTMLLGPTGPRYRAPAPVAGQPQPNRALGAYWDQLLERVRFLPGVEAASIAITIPPDRVAFTDGYEIEGKPAPPNSDHPAVPVPFVSHDYFKTLGIPLLQGRWFDGRDRADSARVTVISEAMARRHFPGENPVGQRLKHGHRSTGNPYMEIIGVVGSVKYQGVHNEDTPAYYELSVQVPARPMWLLVRTKGDAQALAAAVRREIRSLDPNVPVQRVGTMADALAQSVSLPRFRSFLMSIFAGTALLLAAIGIYGLFAYSVAQREQEIGIRMALGATRSGVVGLIVGQGSRLALVGIVLGMAAAIGLTRFLEKMLFGITTSDLVTFASAPLVLAVVAIVASLLPALRAARIDPVTALRQE
jgi:predicted permease